MAPRIPPLPPDEWSEELRPILEAKMAGTGTTLGDNNVFTTFARHPELFRAWLRLGGFLLGDGVIDVRERELVILRTGYNCHSAYEWGQHARLSLQLDIAREEIDRVAEGPDAEGWSEADAALMRACDELHAVARISDATWATLARTYDEKGLIELCSLVGQYHLVAFFLNSAGVELDDGLEGPPPGLSAE